MRVIFLRLRFTGWLFLALMQLQRVSAQSPPLLTFEVDSLGQSFGLNRFLYALEDSQGILSFKTLSHPKISSRFQPYSSFPLPLNARSVYWGKVSVHNNLPYDTRWVLYTRNTGKVDFFWKNRDSSLVHFPTGKYRREAEKAIKEGNHAVAPIRLDAGERKIIFIRIEEIDHSVPAFDVWLYSPERWLSKAESPLKNTITFFEGIFLIMALYNLVLFFTIRFRAYLYYALYLICVATFVAFAVGPFVEPPFGDPVKIIPIGYLAFGAINIFYFLFGRSLLNTPELIPRWDTYLLGYVQFKLLLLLGLQVMLYVNFNLELALSLEFGMMFLDVLLSLLLFGILIRTRFRLAYYFIAGSASVMVVGLSLAVLGHLFNIRHTFVIFLSTIIVEIIFFSLGLGYRIRLSERQKLDAEREKREAQEALNQELSKINTAFGRFVPHEFLKALGHNSILDIQLGDGVEKEVTVLFSDIRDYTMLSEKMSPRENFHFLNSYLGKVGPVIQTYRGFVNQYYGDGIMALFLQSPEDALMAAIEIHRALGYYNGERLQKGRDPIRIGIGLHTGPLMMGVMGDTLRLEAGVVADTVNIASRMEGLTKHYQTSILLSESTFTQIPKAHRYGYRYLGKVQVKGRKEPLGVYECFESEEQATLLLKKQTLLDFNAGLKLYYEQAFAEAAKVFESVLEVNPADKAAAMYLEKARDCLLSGVPEGWDGVEAMLTK